MENNIMSKEELITAIQEVADQYKTWFSKLTDEQVNNVPFEGSWTPGQLMRHVTKSTDAIASVVAKKTLPVERDAAEKVEGLRNIFMDFTTKMQSPDFIVPEDMHYQKQETLDRFLQAFSKLVTNVHNQELTEVVKDFPTGEVSKLEILHFVVFHSKRHLHQLQNIVTALQAQPQIN